jgi:hypothetical protein
MANSVSIALPPQYRGRALADLNQLIEQVEGRLRQRRRAVEHLVVAGKEAAQAAHLLRVEEKRLALLQQSRTVLIAGETPGEAARRR